MPFVADVLRDDSCSFAGHVYDRYASLASPVYDRSHRHAPCYS